MTPDDVVRAEFGSGGRRGYDPREVDDFLEEVVHRMRGGTLDAGFLDSARFGTPRGLGQSGYSPKDVDDLLSQLRSQVTGGNSSVSYNPVAYTDGTYGGQAYAPGRPPGLLKRLFGGK